MRHTPSPPSSRETSLTLEGQTRSKRKRGKSKLDLAGLVGGDSDSSALTQESGDEGGTETAGESIPTGTDGGMEEQDVDDVEMSEPSPGMCFGVNYRCVT
jgi:MRG-binding protein